MNKKNLVSREILYRVLEHEEWHMTQKSLAHACGVSSWMISSLIKTLHNFGAVEKKPLGFRVLNVHKILLYWACTRNLHRDIVYTTFSPYPVSKIEEEMPEDTLFTAFSGYSRKFKDASLTYDEVFVYGDSNQISRKFPKKTVLRPNVIVLEPDPHLRRLSENNVVPFPQLYADLWQIDNPKAEKVLVNLDQRLKLKPIEKFRTIINQLWAKETRGFEKMLNDTSSGDKIAVE
jgi:hypothetical protein